MKNPIGFGSVWVFWSLLNSSQTTSNLTEWWLKELSPCPHFWAFVCVFLQMFVFPLECGACVEVISSVFLVCPAVFDTTLTELSSFPLSLSLLSPIRPVFCFSSLSPDLTFLPFCLHPENILPTSVLSGSTWRSHISSPRLSELILHGGWERERARERPVWKSKVQGVASPHEFLHTL